MPVRTCCFGVGMVMYEYKLYLSIHHVCITIHELLPIIDIIIDVIIDIIIYIIIPHMDQHNTIGLYHSCMAIA